MSRARDALALLVVATCAAGCTTQWYPGYEHRDIARTDVVIRTEPSGATIEFDGVKLPAPAPVRQPVEYDHVETQYDRQSNYGRTMREGMSTPVAVLTFPIWGVASLIHYHETLRRHEYGSNVHEVTAYLPGYDEVREQVTLEGEADHPVTLKLPKMK